MDTIVIKPRNKTQLEAIKAFAMALKIEFETSAEEESYDSDFVKKILAGREDVKNGKGVKIAIEDLWK